MAGRRTVFFVSDQTGVTAETLGRSLLTQFEPHDFDQVTVPFIDSVDKADEVVRRINAVAAEEGLRPIIFSTLVHEELRQRFDHGLRRPSLLAGANKLRYWDLYEETYAILVQQENDAPLPAVVIDEMAHAYEQEAESLQQRHEAQRPPARSARAS